MAQWAERTSPSRCTPWRCAPMARSMEALDYPDGVCYEEWTLARRGTQTFGAYRRIGMPTGTIGICEPVRADHPFGRCGRRAWRAAAQAGRRVGLAPGTADRAGQFKGL